VITPGAGKQALLESSDYAALYRVKVANGSGTLVDLTEWVESGTVTSAEDAPFDVGQVTFAREDAAGNSLAPLMEASPLNVDDDDLPSPQLYYGRMLTVEFAIVEKGEEPGALDWVEVFRGRINRLSFPGRDTNRITAECGDWLGCFLQDYQITTEATYTSGTATEDVMQDILDAAVGVGVVTLYVPSSPGSTLEDDYRQKREGVLAALTTLAQATGSIARPRHDTSGVHRLTYYEPNRAATTAVWSWTTHTFSDLTEAGFEITNVRTALTVWYTDAVTGQRAFYYVEDAAAIAALGGEPWGRREMVIEEAQGSPVCTAATAEEFGDSILADVAQGPLLQTGRTGLNPYLQINDYVEWPANGRLYDSAQKGAIGSITHAFGRTTRHTDVRTIGKPRMGFQTILNMGDRPIHPRILSATPTQSGATVSVAVTFNSAVTEGWRVWARVGASPLSGGEPLAEYGQGLAIPKGTLSHSFSVVNGDYTIVVRAYGQDGSYDQRTLALTVSGIGGGGGTGGGSTDAPTVKPTLIVLSPGVVAGGNQDADAQFVNTSSAWAIEYRWYVNGVAGAWSSPDLAAGTEEVSETFTIGDRVALGLRYTNVGGPGPEAVSHTLRLTGVS
jgi:hypothetical protein